VSPPPAPGASPGAGPPAGRGPDAEPDLDADIDPDLELPDRAGPGQRSVVGAIALGGILGAEARYGLSGALTHRPDGFPWSTLLVNLTGCLLIGVLMATLLQLPDPHRLARPFLGTGVLGGYTTYSTFAVEVQQLVRQHRPATAAGYLVATVLGCAVAVWLATELATRAWRAARPERAVGLGPSA
jgi:CrcB protein